MSGLSRLALAAVGCGLVALSAPTLAQTSSVARPVGDRETITLDPAKAYLLVESDGPVVMMLIREPSQADVDEWEADRAEALARAQRRYAGEMRSYAIDLRERRGGQRRRPPERPVEPTDANFQFTPIELGLSYSFGPQNRFAKSSGSVMLVTGRSVYLTELPAGTYHIYGPAMAAPNGGVVGACFCMGTVKFEMAAGQITDLGQVTNPAGARALSFGEGPVPPQTDPDTATSGFGIEPALSGDDVDPRLRSYTVVPAQLSPGRRFPNWYGLAVDRINPIPGVIAYRRDVIVDVRAEQAAAAQAAAQAAAEADAAAASAEAATLPPS